RRCRRSQGLAPPGSPRSLRSSTPRRGPSNTDVLRRGTTPTYPSVVHVFLGITGASGAPYSRRLLTALDAAGCEVGVTVSSPAVEVLATELYADARLSR